MSDTGLGERDVVAGLARLGYTRARRRFVLVGLAILAVAVAGLVARSVDEVEVVATLLFVPIFLALLYFGAPGGIAAAAVASGVYVFLRADAIEVVGWGEFAGTVVSRATGYLLFGAVGGWAASTLEAALDKLDRQDRVDDETGLGNARALIDHVDLERARSARYRTLFSVVFVEVPVSVLSGLGGRRRRQVLRGLGARVEATVRDVDRAAHGVDGRCHRIAVVLPETAGEGAATFAARLGFELRQFLDDHGIDLVGDVTDGEAAGPVRPASVTLPGDDQALDDRLAAWRAIDADAGPRPGT